MVISKTDLIVWMISGVIALGVGLSSYSKHKTRDRLARELAAMDPERRQKVLSRLNPKMAMEMRQILMERFGIG